MIAIIDYGAGNLRSVANAFRSLGANIACIDQPETLAQADKVVLPGVGAFGAGMEALRSAGFVEPLREVAKQGKPLLGICLGLQYLFESSNEMGHHEGLGLLKGTVTRFPDGELKVPHIGWNQLDQVREHRLLAGLPNDPYAYFVHSYYVEPADPADVIATTDYGIPFVSVAGRDNIIGIQCHPEKSQSVGLRFLNNFLAW
ncbi:MAG: imidazole glycerol phosphate synthase subunit HisH [Chloroflexi bacterium]|nr:imidazole glycerol phosphate synthase subunit HisH [Chloroflexota bacterium]